MSPPASWSARLRPYSRGPAGLSIGGVPLADLLAEFGSPLYVLDEETLAAAAGRLEEALGGAGARLYVAGKANPNPFLWRWLGARGIGLDACSPGEVTQALAAGFAPGEVSFTGCALTAAEMDQLAASGADLNFDSADQARAFAARHPGRPFGLRVNPGEGAGSHASCTTAGPEAKLGIPWGEVPGLVAGLRAQGAALAGLHCHTGSGGLDTPHFVATAARMGALADELGPFEWLSLGGGLGVPHHPDDPPFDLAAYAAALKKLARPGRELRLEPGQAFCAAAGVLAMTVVSTKAHPGGPRFALTDSSYNHYLGTALYQSYHDLEVDLDAAALADRPVEPQHVVGHLCNTGDVFARDRPLPRLDPGDRLLMATCGAYGISRAANYNSRPIPAEVFVASGTPRLIRRRQTVEELSQWYV